MFPLPIQRHAPHPPHQTGLRTLSAGGHPTASHPALRNEPEGGARGGEGLGERDIGQGRGEGWGEGLCTRIHTAGSSEGAALGGRGGAGGGAPVRRAGG